MDINTLSKLNISVPESLAKLLMHDAELFEIYKGEGTEINFNHFLNLLIHEYSEEYKEKISKAEKKVKILLENFIYSPDIRDKMTNNILKAIAHVNQPDRKEGSPVRIGFKPDKTNRRPLEIMADNNHEKGYLVKYLSNMFLDYSSFPIYEREKIIYRSTVNKLIKACHDRQEITFCTKWNRNLVHHVIPYELVYDPEETLNYLLCDELIDPKNVPEEFREKASDPDRPEFIHRVMTYRLSRIVQPELYNPSHTMNEKFVPYFEAMKRYSPQFAIFPQKGIDIGSVKQIELTEKGQKRFRMVYRGRPLIDPNDIHPGEGTNLIYDFKCSESQLLFYFSRFYGDEFRILHSSDWLKKKLEEFHKSYFQQLAKEP